MLNIKNLKIGDKVVLVNDKVGYNNGEVLTIVGLTNFDIKPKVFLRGLKDLNVTEVNLEDISFENMEEQNIN